MIFVGTSGWQYDDWRGPFYPQELPKRRWLAWFSTRFSTVEVNNSFYRLPSGDTFTRWREESGPGFLITVKASRYITHIRRLRDARDSVELFLVRARSLGLKLGPILYQLPPRFPADLDRLESFLSVLPGDVRAAFEFRDRSWETDEVLAVLQRAGAAVVHADRPGVKAKVVVTGEWSYIRFHQGGHGPDGAGYAREKLRRWADRIVGLPATDTFVYFNNDRGGAAVRDAGTLIELLRKRGADLAEPGGA